MSTGAHYQLAGTAPNYTVTTVIDGNWLTDSRRVFPVLLDPSVSFGTSADLGCYVASPGAPDPQVCAGNTGTDNNMSFGSTGYARHLWLQFGDFTGIPADAAISEAELSVTETAASNTNALNLSVYRPTASWSSSISWSTQPTVSTFQQDNQVSTPPGVGNPLSFPITNLVQAWVNGGVPNYGLELRMTDDSYTANTLTVNGFANSAHHPVLTVSWQPRVGQQAWIGSYDHRLSDRMDLHVDYGDRNLVLNALDDSISSPAQALTIRRTYNSLTAAAGTSGMYGPGWTSNAGTDVYLSNITGSSMLFNQPGGAQTLFYRNFAETNLAANDAYLSAGLHATLTQSSSSSYAIKFNQSGITDNFTVPSGATTAWLSSVTDSNGNTTSYTASGTPLHTATAVDTTGQRTVTFSYTSGKVTGMSETLPGPVSGRSWSDSYDSSGRLSTSVDAAGKTSRYCYSGSTNLLTKIITPRGNASGATCSTTNGTDVTDISYDTGGHVQSVTYENGTSTAITVTFAAQATLTTSTNGVTRFTDPYSQYTDYSYDTNDRVVKVIDPLGNTRTATFNLNNDVTASVSPNNYTGGTDPSTTSTYDSNNNTTSVTLPTGAGISATYAGSQTYLPDTITTDLGDVASYGYNTPGQTSSVQQGAATVTIRHQGDAGVSNCGPSGAAAYAGAACETRDPLWTSATPNKHRIAYSYNALGELTSITPPTPASTAPSAETIGYDGYGRPTSVVNSKGDTTGYHYDALDRLTQIDVPGGGTVEYVYDEDGDLQSQTDYNASHVSQNYDNYSYDNLNRLTQQANWTNGTSNLTWDGNSRLLSYADAGGTVSYAYDAVGGLTSLTEPSGSCTGYSISGTRPTSSSGCFLFQLDKSGNRLEIVHPGDVGDEVYGYDTAGHVTTLTGYTVGDGIGATKTFAYTYSYSSTGVPGGTQRNHIIRRTDGLTGNYDSYGYTAEDRLASDTIKNSGGTTIGQNSYCYDLAGNLTLASTTIGASCPGTATFSYNGANEVLSQPFGSHNSYDADGNQTDTDSAATGTSARRQVSYSRGDQVSAFTIGAGSSLTQLHFGVDNSERLDSDISATDDQSILTSPLGITGSTRSHSGTPQTPKYYTRDPQGNLLAMRLGSTHYYYQTDNQQSVLRLLDSTGTVKDSYSYDPYGQVTSTVNTVQPFGYAGGWTDDFSGLVKFGARYYDPSQARFTQTDPVSHPGDVNQASPYPYAGEDPINNTDPTGESLLGDVLAVGIGVASVVATVAGAPAIGLGLGIVSVALSIDIVACDLGDGYGCNVY